MGPDELSLVQDAFATNWIAPLGPHVDKFESEFVDVIRAPLSAGAGRTAEGGGQATDGAGRTAEGGGRTGGGSFSVTRDSLFGAAGAPMYAAALSSGTAALHLALRLIGLQRGDEVFVSTLTFSASVNPIAYEGGRPVFIDSDRTSWNMDPARLEEALKDRAAKGRLPKAVILVHLYGQSADLDAIAGLCAQYGVPLIEDAAEALGAIYYRKLPLSVTRDPLSGDGDAGAADDGGRTTEGGRRTEDGRLMTEGGRRTEDGRLMTEGDHRTAEDGPHITPAAHAAGGALSDGRKSLSVTRDSLSGAPAAVREPIAPGTVGRLGIFSFNGNKIITTSGGGMLVSADKALIDKARFLATQARDPAPHYQHSEIGFNYRMSNVLAAIGRGQLRVLADRVNARRANCAFYQAAFADLPGIEFMPEAAFGRCTRWLTCITVDPAKFGCDREALREALLKENIEARPVWKPMHQQPVFAGCDTFGGEVADDLFARGLCLPSGSNLTRADLERVVAGVKSLFVKR
ncbi:DegT/DnrJ/EryC1/StrS family aminotransferase [Horticoccus luteus]